MMKLFHRDVYFFKTCEGVKMGRSSGRTEDSQEPTEERKMVAKFSFSGKNDRRYGTQTKKTNKAK